MTTVATSTPATGGAPTTLGGRLKRLIWPLIVLAAIITTVIISLPQQYSSTPMGADNPTEYGAQALARILQNQGVKVKPVLNTATAYQTAGAGVTVVVFNTTVVEPENIRSLIETGAEVVLVEPSVRILQEVAPAVTWGAGGGPPVIAAHCTNSDATAAALITTPARTLTFADGCFPVGDGYAMVQPQSGVTLVSTEAIFTNEFLAESGNAALTLRLLGKHPTLLWVAATHFGEVEPPHLPSATPPVLGTLALVGIACVMLAALWRGRRFGKLVPEPLPVLVKSVETTRGRGRLYRRARDHAHAADALRAGTAARLARRLGVASNAGRAELVTAIAAELNLDARQVDHTLYGPPPRDDAELLALTTTLDALEETR